MMDVAIERYNANFFYNYEKEILGKNDNELSYHGVVVRELVREAMNKPAKWKFEMLELFNHESVVFESVESGCNSRALEGSTYYDVKAGYSYYRHPTQKTWGCFKAWMRRMGARHYLEGQ